MGPVGLFGAVARLAVGSIFRPSVLLFLCHSSPPEFLSQFGLVAAFVGVKIEVTRSSQVNLGSRTRARMWAMNLLVGSIYRS